MQLNRCYLEQIEILSSYCNSSKWNEIKVIIVSWSPRFSHACTVGWECFEHAVHLYTGIYMWITAIVFIKSIGICKYVKVWIKILKIVKYISTTQICILKLLIFVFIWYTVYILGLICKYCLIQVYWLCILY